MYWDYYKTDWNILVLLTVILDYYYIYFRVIGDYYHIYFTVILDSD